MAETDSTLPVDDWWARHMCKVGEPGCCRYLTASPKGWSCEKHNVDLAPLLDRRVANKTMNARGDNCSGRLSL